MANEVKNSTKAIDKVETYTVFVPPIRAAHTLIAGATGSGKSVYLRGVAQAIGAAWVPRTGAQVYGIDLKRVELTALYSLPHTVRIVTEAEKVVPFLAGACRLMDDRYRQLERWNRRHRRNPAEWRQESNNAHAFIIVDELADLVHTCKDALPYLVRIGQIGRAARVHLICATQAPQRAVLKAELVQNCGCRVALRCDSAIESRQTIGVPGAETLPLYGECLIREPGKGVLHYAVPYIGTGDIWRG